MKAQGFVHKYGDNVDTDVIIPARHLNTADHKELASHCMEDIDREFVNKVKDGDIMVAGWNFGCGSSREHAPIAIKESGISCVCVGLICLAGKLILLLVAFRLLSYNICADFSSSIYKKTGFCVQFRYLPPLPPGTGRRTPPGRGQGRAAAPARRMRQASRKSSATLRPRPCR